MQWLYEASLKRAQAHGIEGVTLKFTQGVAKRIIPAIAATNAIVAAACVNEAIKILTFCSQTLNTYCMYMGSTGVYSHTFVYERKEDCPVCCSTVRTLTLSREVTLNQLLQMLREGDLRLTAPSVTAATSQRTLYMQNPPALEKATRANLDKALGVLIENGEQLTVTDPMFPGTSVALSVFFNEVP